MLLNNTILDEQELADKIFVFSIRIWIYNLLNLKDPKLNLINFLGQYHLIESIMYVDEMMKIISFSKKQKLDFRNLQCIYIGQGEKKILKSLNFSQNNLHLKNNLEIKSFIDEICIVDFNRVLKEIAIIYAKNGYFFTTS